MNVLPVVMRELREQARQPSTYWLRFLGAAGLVAAGVLYLLGRKVRYWRGEELLSTMQWVLFAAIWGLVPIMTADCISRERREGTLGLLFLTPLKALDVLVAKGLAHGLRAAAVGVATVPVLLIPFLLGGVDWAAVSGVLMLNGTSFCCALVAGLLASSHEVALHRSVAWAYLWASVLFGVLMICGGFWLSVVYSSGMIPFRPAWHVNLIYNITGLLNFVLLSAWGMVSTSALGLRQVLILFAGVAGAGLVACPILLGWSAVNVRRFVLESPCSPLRLRLERVFCTPRLALGVFRRWMRWSLERNPVGWLERRTWQARLVTWSWLAVLVSIYSLLSSDTSYFSRSFEEVQSTVSMLFLASMAATTAASFRRERENRILELLLVSPLSPWQIVRGRLWGLWGQFLPALVLLVMVWLEMSGGLHRWANFLSGARVGEWSWEWASALRVVAAFMGLPAIGLYFSLRCRSLLAAFALTLIFLVLLQWASGAAQTQLWPPGPKSLPATVSSRTLQLGVLILPVFVWGPAALFLGHRLCRNLQRRRFQFS